MANLDDQWRVCLGIIGMFTAIREKAIRADERQICISKTLEVAASFRAQGAHVDAWGAASVANYLNECPPFGFIGPYKPGPEGRPWAQCSASPVEQWWSSPCATPQKC